MPGQRSRTRCSVPYTSKPFRCAIGALVFVERRDWATAIDYGNAAKETAPTVYFRGFAFGFLAPALCHTGAVDEGLPVLEQIVPMAKAARHELAWTFLAPRLADAYLTAGDDARAQQTLLEIHGAAASRGASFLLGASGRCLGEVALLRATPMRYDGSRQRSRRCERAAPRTNSDSR